MPETTISDPESQLKAERIQGLAERLKAERIQERLKAERIQNRLADLPGWSVAESESALERTYTLPTIRAAVVFVSLLTEIGEARGYVPEIVLRYQEVTVRVSTDLRPGVTDLDFDFARLFDQRLF